MSAAPRSRLGEPCKVLMDLGGPKIRTGRIEPGPPVVKWRPVRDALGRVVTPATICLKVRGHIPDAGPGVAATLTVPRRFLARLAVGDIIRLRDARGARRSLRVASHAGAHCLVETRSTAYVTNGTRLRVRRRGKKPLDTSLGGIPRAEQGLLLQPGDALLLFRAGATGREAERDANGAVKTPAAIACTLPRALALARRGEATWFDDGRIGGVIEAVRQEHLLVRITHAKTGGTRLRAERGVNLPDTKMDIGAITRRDLRDCPWSPRTPTSSGSRSSGRWTTSAACRPASRGPTAAGAAASCSRSRRDAPSSSCRS